MTEGAPDHFRATRNPDGGREEYAIPPRGALLELAAARRELRRSSAELEDLGGRLEQLTQQLAHADRQLLSTDAERVRAESRSLELEQRHRELVTEQRERVRELEQIQSTLLTTLAQVRRDVERAERSRAWRWGHFAATLAWRARRRRIKTAGALADVLGQIDRTQSQLRTLPAAPAAEPVAPAPASVADERRSQLPLSEADEAAVKRYRVALASELRERLGAPAQLPRWPSVTAVVVTRDGRALLERLIAGLIEATDYPALDVIVVDNASSDGSVEYLEQLTTPFELRVIAAGENLSFSEANNLGAEQATGELLLLLNNDIEPFEPGWLRELVRALAAGRTAVGATLIHAEPPGAPSDAEPLVQHRAIAFRWENDTVRGFNVDEGESLWAGSFGTERRCAAVTAACMLISRETFIDRGGLDIAYRFGTEDIDLGLRLLRGGGELAGVGRSVLVHRESSSQSREDRSFRMVNRSGNRRVLLERWGPQLLRSYRLGRLARDRFWTDGAGPHIAITVTTLERAPGWGDWYTAHELGDALDRLGWRVTYIQRRGDDWYQLPPDLDYVLSLMDPFDLRRVPAHVITIAWIRNWTDRWLSREWFERIDVLLASSGGSIERIERATGRTATHFPLATNPGRFATADADPELACDYVYTGNRWGEERAIEHAIAPRRGERFAAFGKGWEEIKAMRGHARGPIEYDRLASLYASSKLVLDDTQGPTLPYGALNARVLDALAAGALPVTDCRAGVLELFDGEFPVWDSAATLRGQLDALLGDEPRRQALVKRYRRVVLSRHTYAHRAGQLRDALVDQERRLSFAIKIGAPDQESAVRWGDLYFARALGAELQRRGHRSLVQTLDRWEDESGLTREVALHLKGLTRYQPKPGQFNVLWSISHPAQLSGEECDGMDLVLVASQAFAHELRERTRTPVAVLAQATDPRVFYPDPDPALEHELVYVANSRNVLRPIMRDLLPTDRDLAVWGANWSGLIPRSYVVAEHLPNDRLRHVYSSAGIVLCDHWDDMREHGYVSNRIYDALACGAFVICDDVAGVREQFGDAVVTYRGADELERLIETYLDDPGQRRERALTGRELVLEHHTFAHAVDALLGEIERAAAGGGPPDRLLSLRRVQGRRGGTELIR